MTRDFSITRAFATAARAELMTIREMARTYDVSLRALRFYEDRGLLQPLRQGPTRYYDSAARVRVETILKGKTLGFTLSEIRDLIASRSPGSDGAIELALQPGQILAQIDMLAKQRQGLDQAIAELQATHERLSGGTPAFASGASRASAGLAASA